MPEMKTLEIGGKVYEVVDDAARTDIDTLEAGMLTIDITDTDQGTANLINADTASNSDKLGGVAASSYALKSDLVDLIYPVGSIYMSVNSTEPSNIFGGTWERIKDTFLLSAGDTYSAGATGGEAKHTLSIAEMPKHDHYGIFHKINAATGTSSGNWFAASAYDWGSSEEYQNIGGCIAMQGSSSAHNNMPPYLAVYMWKRTA